MLRLSPRVENAPTWRDINESTPCAVKRQCTRRGAPTDALRADFDRFESLTGVVAGLVPASSSLKAQRVGWAKAQEKPALVARPVDAPLPTLRGTTSNRAERPF